MKTDVYDLIIDVCIKTMEELNGSSKSPFVALGSFNVIMGICNGAKASEKEK